MATPVITDVSPNEAAERAGITYRQLTHWVRNRYLAPSGASPRVNWSTYTPQDIEKLRLMRACSETGWQPRYLTAALPDVTIGTGPGYTVAHHEMQVFVGSNPGPHVIVATNIRTATARRRETAIA
jgi:DNA-binding transcriptional MerR regulator